MPDRNHRVFISYSRRNGARVERLARDLRADGFEVWFDDWSILGGDSIIAEIENGLARAESVVVCLSPASLRSVWAREEVQTALMRALRKGKPRIVPALLSDCELPPMLAHRKYVDFRSDYASAYSDLKAALAPREARRTPSANPYRFVEYEQQTRVDEHGGSTIWTSCSLVAVGSPLSSVRIPLHHDKLPFMKPGNLTVSHSASSSFEVETLDLSESHVILQVRFNPSLIPGKPPIALEYQIGLVRAFPTNGAEVAAARAAGVADCDDFWDGVLLPVPSASLRYRLRLSRARYSEPQLRVALAVGGSADRAETTRASRLGRIRVVPSADEYLFSLDIGDISPGVSYGAAWRLLP